MEPKCVVKNCPRLSVLTMCQEHLNNPIRTPFQIVKNIVIEPPPTLKAKSHALQLASNLLSMSPLDLKMSFKQRKWIQSQIDKSIEMNKGCYHDIFVALICNYSVLLSGGRPPF